MFSRKNAWLGAGLISNSSKIRVRLLSRDANERFGEEFFARRARWALDYRATVMGEDFDCCRLVFGEADGLPGVSVDRYNDLLVAQIMSAGMEQRKQYIYRALCTELERRGTPVAGIFERNESPLRKHEGLEQVSGWYRGDFLPPPSSPQTEICENGVRYIVDVENGQKTGFFLDQKYNRHAVAAIARGRRVLDCFTHTGTFALNAAAAGAASVAAADVSAAALELAARNAQLNGCADKIEFICADVFELLPLLIEQHAEYDLIILDPPAFTKSRKTVSGAARGYREINSRAMRLLPRGGYLASCSCSHFMTDALFAQMLRDAARDAGVGLRLVEQRRAAPDHPVLLSVPETDYLKFYLLQII